MLHLSLRTCTVAVHNFLSANLLCSAMSLLFCISCGTWLVSIGSNGISMISDSLGFGLGVCVCIFVCVRACMCVSEFDNCVS